MTSFGSIPSVQTNLEYMLVFGLVTEAPVRGLDLEHFIVVIL